MDSKMMQLVAVVERGVGEDKKAYWTRIGVAFENTDGSFNLRFEYLPARMDETTIQMRPFNPRNGQPAAATPPSTDEAPGEDAVEASERPRRQPAKRKNGQE